MATFNLFASEIPPKPIIHQILVQGADVFDFNKSPTINKFPYTWINVLHIQTKEMAIRWELLFKVGDPVDPFIMKETERRLRAASYTQIVTVTWTVDNQNNATVLVYVRDAWTTEPQINLSGVNGVDSYELGFKEKNFLGYGKTVSYFYKKTGSNLERELGYTDNHLFGSNAQASFKAINRTGGHQQTYTLGQPFYSAATRWSASASYDHDISLQNDYVNNESVSEFQQEKNTRIVSGGLKLGTSNVFVTRMGLRYQDESLDYTATENTDRPLPEPIKKEAYFVDFQTLQNNFTEQRHINKMNRVEDINLGHTFMLSPGVTPKAVTGQANTAQIQSSLTKNFSWNSRHLVETAFSASAENITVNPQNERNTADLYYFWRFRQSQTAVFHTRFDWGHKLDTDNQITLGRDNGLRSYKEGSFIGNKSWLFNAEDRLFWADRWLELLSVGGVAFFDTGYVWQQGQAVQMNDLRSSVGAGFRFGLINSSNESILRLDLSRQLNTDPGEAKWVVSFGTSQAF